MPVPGSNIAMLRRTMGLSQRQLAKAAEVDLSTLSRLESGKGGYSPESLDRISKVLSVSKGTLFAEPGVVEAAALGMREVPLLVPAELLQWPAIKDDLFVNRDRFLHAPLRTVSAHAFAIEIVDDANDPVLQVGDQALFDAARQPRQGSFVIGQMPGESIHIGRFRPLDSGSASAPAFALVPERRVYPEIISHQADGLRLRGVLAEIRRIVPA